MGVESCKVDPVRLMRLSRTYPCLITYFKWVTVLQWNFIYQLLYW